MIKYTFVGDGSSDRALMQIIDWALNEQLPTETHQGQFADFRYLDKPPSTLADRLKLALENYPCDILFVHRDAEKTKDNKIILAQRKAEVQSAVPDNCVHVPIIPIKMMETWLLTDKIAILKAAGNPNSKIPIDLPPLNRLEIFSTPKETLHGLLKKASGLKGRRLDSFNPKEALHRVAEYSKSFTALRELESYNDFETSLQEALLVIRKQSS